MAYTKVGWASDTPVNAANLDQMDQGIKDNATLLDNHNSQHENGGSDEISVAGLSGNLADRQNPVNHAGRHEAGGADEMSISSSDSVWDDYEIQKNGTDGSGIINFKT